MSTTARVTVTLPAALVARIDRLEQNRSRFVIEAVARELARRSRDGLLRSIRRPHPAGVSLAAAGMNEWAACMPTGDDDLVDRDSGTPVRWVAGKGWLKSRQ